MSVDRPTFSESWYRVERLRPRLRASAQTCRQRYRGQVWHVVRDPSSHQYFRLSEPAYQMVGLLDGRRTVAEAWSLVCEQLGDAAPTQGEAIQLLGQLYGANLLQGELPGDAAGLFDRFRKRVRREVGGVLTNLLFPRIPLWDPNRALDRWTPLAGRMFSKAGLAAWSAILLAGAWAVTGRWGDLRDSASNVLSPDPENLLWMYAAFVAIKVVHELGHALSCKHFGRSNGGGDVHTLGVMFLVFMPMPYVDASSSWAFRDKRHRIVVAAAGMYVELAVAAMAALVWRWTSAGSTAHGIAYNVMFIASVSTLLFNANPLLRYDGYYILSDWMEMPNLAQRSRDYLYYLVKRHLYGARQARTTAQTPGERYWLVLYGITAGIYRVFISAAVVVFVGQTLFIVGVLLAMGAIVGWVAMPMGRWARYLLTSPELERCRGRALAVTAGACAAIVTGVGLVPMPDRGRAEGVVEPAVMEVVHMPADGFVDELLPTGTSVTAEDMNASGRPLLVAHDDRLDRDVAQARADRQLLQARRNAALEGDVAMEQALAAELERATARLERLERQQASLTVRPRVAGTWVAPALERVRGGFVKRGEPIGLVATLEVLRVRAVTDQSLGPRIGSETEPGATVRMRVRGDPAQGFAGVIEEVLPAQTQLPSESLGYLGGGLIAVSTDDQQGRRTARPFFEVRIRPEPAAGPPAATLMSGQRVVVRFDLPPRPLAVQWWRSLQQLVQRRFQS